MKKRKLEDLKLMDDFLFQEMVSKEGIGEEFCRILLSSILGRPIPVSYTHLYVYKRQP